MVPTWAVSVTSVGETLNTDRCGQLHFYCYITLITRSLSDTLVDDTIYHLGACANWALGTDDILNWWFYICFKATFTIFHVLHFKLSLKLAIQNNNQTKFRHFINWHIVSHRYASRSLRMADNITRSFIPYLLHWQSALCCIFMNGLVNIKLFYH